MRTALMLMAILLMGCATKEAAPTVYKPVSINYKGNCKVDGLTISKPYSVLMEVGSVHSVEVRNSTNMDVYLVIIVDGKTIYNQTYFNGYYGLSTTFTVH